MLSEPTASWPPDFTKLGWFVCSFPLEVYGTVEQSVQLGMASSAACPSGLQCAEWLERLLVVLSYMCRSEVQHLCQGQAGPRMLPHFAKV